jgi:hypothetical protein
VCSSDLKTKNSTIMTRANVGTSINHSHDSVARTEETISVLSARSSPTDNMFTPLMSIQVFQNKLQDQD